MKLRDKYKDNIVLFELKEAVMYTMLETAVMNGLDIPSQHDVEIMFNKFISLENPLANPIAEINHITNN